MFTRSGQNTLYNTTNREYGKPWVQDISKGLTPTYSEIVDSMNDFRKAQRLIKSKVIKEKLEQEGIDPNSDNIRYQKKTTFHAKEQGYRYPTNGLNVGPAIYRTNNMNYGQNPPAQIQIQDNYFPCNSTFTKGFTGGSFKFNGLNTVKTISNVHNTLNDF